MGRGPVKPKVSDIRRALRGIKEEGGHAERVEVDTTTGNFTVFLARTPNSHPAPSVAVSPRPEIDLLREVDAHDEQGRAA
jgi:hypothetical protein